MSDEPRLSGREECHYCGCSFARRDLQFFERKDSADSIVLCEDCQSEYEADECQEFPGHLPRSEILNDQQFRQLLDWVNQSKSDEELRQMAERERDQMKQALLAFTTTIEATGGVIKKEDGATPPEADEDWDDLGAAYVKACEVLGIKAKVKSEVST